MVEVVEGARMVAAQLLLINHFLMSLSQNTADINAYLNINSVSSDVGGECSYGCTMCSPINGCLACKPPFFLLLHREGIRQTASCTRHCPRGFYKLKKKRNGFCTKCTMRGCVECLDSKYCSSCDTAYVNFFGKCIKQKSDESLEQHGLYTTRRSYEYSPTSESNGTSSSSRGTWPASTTSASVTPTTLEFFTVTPSTKTSSNNSSATLASPGEDRVPFPAPKAPPSENPVTVPVIGTRFHFTTPNSPILFENFSPSITPYVSSTTIHNRKPCRRKGNRRPGRQRTHRKDRKGRRGKKKEHRDRKNRRRKGRRERMRHRGCRRREKNRRDMKTSNMREGSIYNTPSSQDPAMRHLNSAEPRNPLLGEVPLHQSQPGHENLNSYQKTDDIKVSLLEETTGHNHIENDDWSNDLPIHIENNPRVMASFKGPVVLPKISTRRENENPFLPESHRMRHENSRAHTKNSPFHENSQQLKKRPRTKSGGQRSRHGRRRRIRNEVPSSVIP